MKPQCDTTATRCQSAMAARGDAKGAAALAEQELALLGVRPPALLDMVEVGDAASVSAEQRALAADVAGEGAALAHQRLDRDRQA